MQARILIVDDDQDILSALTKRLSWMGHEVVTAEEGEEALRLIADDPPDVVLLDIELPGLSGLDVLKRLNDLRTSADTCVGSRPSVATPLLPAVIVLTAFGSIGRAVEAMQLGAFDFLTKPFDPDHLGVVLDKAVARVKLARRLNLLQAEVQGRYQHVVGQSPAMAQVIEHAKRAAGSTATVLLLGETGTGKEVLARALHGWSPRAQQPFVVINCAALPESLLENELFGHEKGAYTGALKREAGKIEAAEGGTVFLDEIGDMPIGLQTRLLRVLQDQEFYRVGGNQPIKTNVRFIAATNKELKESIRLGTFREDLFYRLNVVTLTLPPLRERKEDVPALVEHFLRRGSLAPGHGTFSVGDDALELLREYHWPGNVRELENLLARAMVLCPGDRIEPEHLGIAVTDMLPLAAHLEGEPTLHYHAAMEAYGRKVIEEALRRTGWNQTRAAELLGLQRTYLTKLIKQKGVPTKPPSP